LKVFLAKDEEAVGELRRAIEANRNFAAGHFYLAVALVELSRLDEARHEVREGLSIDPTFTIRRYRGDAPSDNPIFMSRRRRSTRSCAILGFRRDKPSPEIIEKIPRAARQLGATE
jgi:tetratricopeptide (TPR) repeat protein